MKKQILFIIALAIIGISSCSKDDNNSSIKNVVVNTISSGTWKITYYFNSVTEETSSFAGYNFTFDTNNVLTTTNGTSTYTGSWSLMNNNSSDDSINDLDFLIAFASPAKFTELSEDWEILLRTDVKIELRHVSGGNGGTDLLTFEKN